MVVLLLSTSENQHAHAVQEHLGSLSADFIRFNFDQQSNKRIGFASDKNGKYSINGRLILANEVSGVFLHHPFPPHLEYEGSDFLDSSLLKAGWINTLNWLEAIFSDAIWINKPSHSRTSASILAQLSIASELGIRVPKTLLTNDLEQLRAFSGLHEKIAIKSGPLPGVNIKGRRLLTHLINPTEITNQELHLSPCLFQEYIEKQFELRIHVIQNDIYACKIDSQRSSSTRIDWRNYQIAHTPHSPFVLDENLADICRNITNRLQLNFGILDVIITPTEEPVFLECNSQGHWLWIEELTKMPITKSVVHLLLKKG